MNELLTENGWLRRSNGVWFHENYGCMNFAYAYRIEAERKMLRGYITGCCAGFAGATILIAFVSFLWRVVL